MTTPNHVLRLYVIVATLAVFFALWTNIAIHPWKSQSAAAPLVPGSSAVAIQTGEDGESVRLVPAQSSAQIVSAKPVTTTRTS